MTVLIIFACAACVGFVGCVECTGCARSTGEKCIGGTMSMETVLPCAALGAKTWSEAR